MKSIPVEEYSKDALITDGGVGYPKTYVMVYL